MVDQAAEDRPPPDPAADRLGDSCVRAWRMQLQGSMRPLPVVRQRVLGKDVAQVSSSEDQHPVGDLGADGQHEAFGEAVRPRTPRRDLEYFDPRVRQDRVERSRKLTGPIADEEPEPGGTFARSMTRLRACCVVQGPSGCPVTPSTCR